MEANLPSEVDIDLQAKGRVLGDIDTNARPGISPRKVSFQTIMEENTMSLANDGDASLLDFSTYKVTSPSKIRSKILLQVSACDFSSLDHSF